MVATSEAGDEVVEELVTGLEEGGEGGPVLVGEKVLEILERAAGEEEGISRMEGEVMLTEARPTKIMPSEAEVLDQVQHLALVEVVAEVGDGVKNEVEEVLDQVHHLACVEVEAKVGNEV